MDLNIKTAKELRDADLKRLRKHFNVVMERIVKELRCISCLSLEYVHPPRKQMMCSKAFGRPLIELREIEEVLSHYANLKPYHLLKPN